MDRAFPAAKPMPTLPPPSPRRSATAKPQPTGPKEPRLRQVPAVSRAVAILRLLGKAQHPLGVKAIADALDLVPSTCLHIIRVLVAEDLVKPEPGTKRYMLASGMIQLARSVLAGGGFAHLSQPSLDLLASAFGVTAMGVEITPKQTVVVLSISRSEQPFRVHTDVGSQFSTLVSATGRLIAAHSGATWKQLKTQFQAVVWDNPPTFEQWKQEVELAKLQGWAVDQDHFMRGITVVAVPLFAANGVLTHTLVAVGLTSQLNKAATTALAAAMLKEADRIGQSLID